MVLVLLGLMVVFLVSAIRYTLGMLRTFRELREQCEPEAVERCRVAALRAVCSIGFLGFTSLQLVAQVLCGPEWGGLRLIGTAIRAALVG